MATATAASLSQAVAAQSLTSTSAAASSSRTRVQTFKPQVTLRFAVPRLSAFGGYSSAIRSSRKHATRRASIRCLAQDAEATAVQASDVEVDEKTMKAVRKVMAGKLNVDIETVKPDKSLSELQIDSLDQVEIMMEIEEIYDLHLEDQNAPPMKTVMDVAKYIAAEIKKTKGAAEHKKTKGAAEHKKTKG